MAANVKYEAPLGPPPGLALQAPPQVHHDAGPYYPPNAPVDSSRGPQTYPPAQDPSGGYMPSQGWNQGPPGGPWQGPPGQQPPYGYYGQPGPQQGMYYQQGQPAGYYDQGPNRSGSEGCCAALFAGLACCCCLELLF